MKKLNIFLFKTIGKLTLLIDKLEGKRVAKLKARLKAADQKKVDIEKARANAIKQAMQTCIALQAEANDTAKCDNKLVNEERKAVSVELADNYLASVNKPSLKNFK